jgi:glycosyltransferase involved in cell wall biosynthesis
MSTDVRHESPVKPATAALPARQQPTSFNVTVVIPTRNETGNVQELVRQLDASLGDLSAEILFVDDSDDDTPDVIERVALESPRPVRLMHRTGADRTGGLGGAIVAGLRTARPGPSSWMATCSTHRGSSRN